MSNLRLRIENDMKEALKSGEKQRLGAIRLIISDLKKQEIDKQIKLDDQQIVSILEKMLKQRRDSIDQFQKANRQDLADKEEFEVNVIQQYMPKALTEAEVDSLIAQAVTATSAHSMQDMGKVMAHLKPLLQGRADMGVVSNKIKQHLS